MPSKPEVTVSLQVVVPATLRLRVRWDPEEELVGEILRVEDCRLDMSPDRLLNEMSDEDRENLDEVARGKL